MASAGKSPDRRVQRTHQILLDALVELITERGYERLTIQTILDRASVGRATFYAHFESKDALLEMSIGGLRGMLVRAAELRPGERLGFSLPFFDHLDSHRRIYQMTAGRRGEVTVGRLIRRMLRELVHADVAAAATNGDGAQVDLITEYIVGALWSTTVWWMSSESTLAPSEVNRVFRRLAFSGLPGTASPIG